MSPAPTLRVERALLRQGVRRLACIDEVGRGALAGPVSVGVTVVDLSVGPAPRGLRDSKLLTGKARQALLPGLRRWPLASAVGHAQSSEIDAAGILGALRVAAARAFAELGDATLADADLALLDGSHDWLRVPQRSDALFPDPRDEAAEQLADLRLLPRTVVTRVRADMSCAGVAAASVLAKCARDAIMVDLDRGHPQYGWAQNKGYSAPEHIAALRRYGTCPLHRLSWNLPGVGESPDGVAVCPDDLGSAPDDPEFAQDDPGFAGDALGLASADREVPPHDLELGAADPDRAAADLEVAVLALGRPGAARSLPG